MQIHEHELIYRFNLYERNMQTMKYSRFYRPIFLHGILENWLSPFRAYIMASSENMSFSRAYPTHLYNKEISELSTNSQFVSHSSGAECCVTFTLYLYLSN